MDKNMSLPPPLVEIDPYEEELSDEVLIEFLLQENILTQSIEEESNVTDTYLKNDTNYSESSSNNNTNKCILKLNSDEIALRITKLPEHKMKSTLNTLGLLPEEIEMLKNDSKGSTAYFKSV